MGAVEVDWEERGGGCGGEGVTRSVYRATCHPLYQRVSRRPAKTQTDWKGLGDVGCC